MFHRLKTLSLIKSVLLVCRLPCICILTPFVAFNGKGGHLRHGYDILLADIRTLTVSDDGER